MMRISVRTAAAAGVLAALLGGVQLLPAAADYPPTPTESAPTAPAPATLDLGSLVVYVNGAPVQVTQSATSDAVTLSGAGWSVSLGTLSAGGRPLALVDGHLVIAQSGGVTLDISGFNADSYAALYLYSNPVYLGSVKVDAQGKIVGALAMPAGAPLGSHTLQLVGTASNGKKLVVAIGVLIKPKTISPNASRFAIAGVRPRAKDVWKVGAAARMQLQLLRLADGRALSAATVKTLPKCAVKARVSNGKTGKVLLASACMGISSKGLVTYAWKVPASALGSLRVVYQVSDTGRPTLTRTVLLKVTK